MKKVIAILLITIIAAALLASCSSYKDATSPAMGGNNSGGDTMMYAAFSRDGMSQESIEAVMDMYAPAPSEAPMAPMQDMDYGEAGMSVVSAISTSAGNANAPASAASEGLAEKIIYSIYADIETVNFDDTIEKVDALLARNGAFIENSYVGGRNYAQTYHGVQTHRTANYVIRIPVQRLEVVEASLEELGNVMSRSRNGENITSQFYDVQSRLNSYRIQEERLLDMLSKADNVPDMIAIEQRLAEVRYDIESLTTTLNNWQNRVDYSTLTLNIYEVAEFTEIIPVQQRTYWQQVGDGLKSTTIGVGRFFTNLFKWIIVNLPVLIILAVIVIVIIVVARRGRRHRGERAAGQGRRYYTKKRRFWKNKADQSADKTISEENKDEE